MRNTTLIVVLLMVIFTPFTKLQAQTQITSCNAQFTDKGGEFSNYLNNENSEWLICPDDSTQFLSLTFTHVNIEAAENEGIDSTGCYDLLYIYDGMDDSAPLIGSFCGEESGSGKTSFMEGHTLNVGDYFKPKNVDGCFFLRFDSDNSKNLSGWSASVSCCVPSLVNGLTDGIDVPVQSNNGNVINMIVDNTCTREGNLGLFTAFQPSGNICYTSGLTLGNQSFYAFTSNPSGGFVELEIDSVDSVGEMEMIIYGPVELDDSTGVYTGGYINDCVKGDDPWSLFFNAGPSQTYILGVATENAGKTSVGTLASTVGLGGVLPVELIEYKIQTRNEQVELNWTTAQEINNDRFEIYRSTDGLNFEMAGTQKASNRPNVENTYKFNDLPASRGLIYYYVKQIDIDGRSTDFSILKTRIDQNTLDFTTYPNPSHGGEFTLKLDKQVLNDNARIQMFDNIGRELLNQPIYDSKSLRLDDLQAGIYVIRVTSGASVVTKQHIVH